MAEPRIQYARTSDGVSIAYAVAGNGPTLVRTAFPGWTHAQLDCETFPNIYEPLVERLTLVLYDACGTG